MTRIYKPCTVCGARTCNRYRRVPFCISHRPCSTKGCKGKPRQWNADGKLVCPRCRMREYRRGR